jgi:hypothetical protein
MEALRILWEENDACYHLVIVKSALSGAAFCGNRADPTASRRDAPTLRYSQILDNVPLICS